MPGSERGRRAWAVAFVVAASLRASIALAAEPAVQRVTCASKPGEREHCPADTSRGVILAESSGHAPCLLGKTWGYDDKGVWVSDGCTATFVVGKVTGEAQTTEVKTPEEKKKALEYIPNVGFRLIEGEKGQVYVRLYSYFRYLNQKGLDPTYVDSFGITKSVQIREDVQLNKAFIPFSGWFLTPDFRYLLYIWSANTAQGQPAQTVVAGNLNYTFNRFVTFGVGVGSLPSTRTTEGQFPYWLGVDERLIADEFFRGSYTTGLWLKGELLSGVKYQVMAGNNLSTLGVSAAQLAAGLNTQSFMLAWLPSTGEFGLYGTFGDFDDHQQVATRFGSHYTHSREDKQSQPGTDSIENSQIRLSDGNNVFAANLFGPGVAVQRVTYQMVSVDAGIKYRGFSLEAEYYWRFLTNFTGQNTDGIADVKDHGFQVQASAMVLPKAVQVYLSGSEILGQYGNGSEIRAGANWYILKERGLRLNVEWIHLNKCPVGYTSVPYPVGGNGDIFHANLEMNF